ncbi:MAG: hypothetical protein HY585_00275, partial [Candidatus Omnitrophica bacterium]|nr:hypothetical protein [Candidatus Omnitrophota bacterium]
MRLASSVLFVFLLLGIFSFNHLLAHEEGAPFSGAIIEPLKLHHAHIEDEQKINLFFLDGARDVLKHTFEMAWHYDDNFRWGSEVIIPFSNEGENDGHRVYGLGDIEFQPLKYAVVNKPQTILTAMVAITPPTGSRSKGFSKGKTGIAPHLFLDQAWRNWYVGSNQAIEIEVGHEHEVKYEYSAALA